MKRCTRFVGAALAAVAVLVATSVVLAQVSHSSGEGAASNAQADKAQADKAIAKMKDKISRESPGGTPAAPSLNGPWRTVSLWIRGEDGQYVEYSQPAGRARPGRPCYVLIGKTTFTVRLGEKPLLEASYTTDPTQSPPTIDLQSKDGDMLGIYRKRKNGVELSINDRDAGRPTKFGLSGNGMLILLSRFPNRKLFVCNADGSDRRLLASETVFVRSLRPAWSSDGRKVAFEGTPRVFEKDGDKSHVFVADVESGRAKDLGPGAAPRWSPDGKKIAFHTAERLFEQVPYSVQVLPRWDESHVWVVDAEGGEPKDLGPGSSPAWSPDGKWIACCDLAQNGTCVMRSDGSERETIGPGSGHLAWSPNGEELAYSAHGLNVDGEAANIGVYNLKTKKSRTLLDDRYGVIRGSVSWSPDGRWISFLARDPRMACELALVRAEGHDKGFRVLVPQDGDGNRFTDSACWDKDGKRILVGFHVKRDDKWLLCFVDPEGKGPIRPLAGQDDKADHIAPEFSPDCTKIVWTEVVDSDR